MRNVRAEKAPNGTMVPYVPNKDVLVMYITDVAKRYTIM